MGLIISDTGLMVGSRLLGVSGGEGGSDQKVYDRRSRTTLMIHLGQNT